MTKARSLADLMADGNSLSDGVVSVAEVSGAAPLASPSFTGDISVTGTVDGRDVAADGIKLDGVEAGATADQTAAEIKTAYENNVNTNAFTDAEQTKLTGIETGATADQTKADIDALNVDADTLDGQHGAYYTGYTDTAVANLVDSSPATLDTLNELAAALGDDPNFATTTATNIGTKVSKSGDTMTGGLNITSGNLLVGTTVTDGGYDDADGGATATFMGASIGGAANGTAFVSRRAAPLQLNRQANDGDIAVFRKNGTTVGSIGANGSRPHFIHPTYGGLRVDDYRVNPATTAGANWDNSLDLGAGGTRWKDLYLSGTANAANFNTTSDATLKTNVETLSGSLDAVKSLRGVSFDWLENGGSEIGVIAQEVEAVLPDVVSTNDEGIKSVKYGNMVAVLIEAIKEQQAQIDELKAQLNS